MYLHCINLDDPYPCVNIVVGKQLPSYELQILSVPQLAYKKITDIPVEKLPTEAHLQQVGIMTVRWGLMWMGSILRTGGKVGFGMNYPKWFGEKQNEQIKRISEAEIEFEKIRREINKDLPSRLTCIFLADNTDDGRIHLHNMLFNLSRPYVVDVSPGLTLKIIKVDSKYFDKYMEEKNPDYIINYWKGVASNFENYDTWEYLFEGSINIINESQIDYIKQFGVFEAPEKPY